MLLFARTRWPELDTDDRFTWRCSEASDIPWSCGTAVRVNRECDVYFSTTSYLTPWFLTVPSVLAVHDLVAFDASRLPNRRSALVERATIRPALRRARRIVTISESTRRDLVRVFPHVEGKSEVVHCAADERFASAGENDDRVRHRYDLRRPYVLAVGTLEPRKNLPRLIEAFGQLSDDARSDHELILVGARGWETDETFEAIAREDSRVRALGYVDENELPALYRGATVFAFPSLYEGFGLPVLEAMQCGTPVVAARTSSIPEIGGDALRYVDPMSIGDMRDALAELLSDPQKRRQMSAEGLRRAAQFGWDRAGAATLRVLEAAGASTAH